MLEEKIKPGQVYEHFKGESYKVVGIEEGRNHLSLQQIKSEEYLVFSHAYNSGEKKEEFKEEQFDILRGPVGRLWINGFHPGEYIIYKQPATGKIYIRSRQDFTGDKVFEDGTRKKRFMLVI